MTNTNITDIIIKATGKEILWRINELHAFLQWMKHIERLDFSYWEDEENWASILKSDGGVIGFVWIRHPLIFLVKSELELFTQIKEQWGYIEIITVSKLGQKELSLNNQTALEVFNSNLGSAIFSAEDLWFKTNSI